MRKDADIAQWFSGAKQNKASLVVLTKKRIRAALINNPAN
jgi:hypothetical protein